MADYDLTRLNPRQFEHLIQALSVEIFGFKTIIFGDGPDGGREATFQGNTNYYSSGNDPWNGYIVIQAKFKQRPQGSENDGEWALQELKKEFTDFANPKKIG